tara:strand:+ start:9736 stop:10161 length:426 start_codon:yes stop_codon:yes gene_type:complete
MLDIKFMQKMSFKTRKAYVDHIFEKGKDVFGRPFKSYSSKYGERKRANKFKRQSGAYATKVTPVLTGDLKNDAKPFATSTSFGIKFAAHGGKVESLNRMKRELSSDKQPLPKEIIETIEKDVNKEIKKQFPNKTTKIVLGK